MQPDVCQKCCERWKCEVKWGMRCNRNGGKKIPRFRRTDNKGLYVVTAGPGEEIRIYRNPWRGSAIDHNF